MVRVSIVVLALVAVGAVGALAYQSRTAAWVDDAVVVERFTEVWGHHPDTWQRNSFLGIQTWQNPFDVWVTLEVIQDVKPDVIVETGTYRGGSALVWAMYLAQVNPDGRVVTVDVTSISDKARSHPLAEERITFLTGSSTAPGIVRRIAEAVEGKRAMFILDSLHTRDHVLAELRAYADLVDVGSYIVVQDGVIGGHPLFPDQYPGPWEAVEAFLAENDDFVVDESRERLLVTFNPNGFLKRIR